MYISKQMNKQTVRFLELVARIAQFHEINQTFGIDHPSKDLTKETLQKSISRFDFKAVDPKITRIMGFAIWDEESEKKHLLLIPLWLFNYLPDDRKLICIDGSEVEKKDADNDIRMGCVAYMIEVGSEFEEKME